MTAGAPVLTVAQMRAAEQALIGAGETVASLMERAGQRAAEWVWRLAASRSVTVLCGPGNNGGDGYVIARELAGRGAAVTVVAPLEPTTPAAIAARAAYGGPFAEGAHGGVLVDCLFGTGLTRALPGDLAGLLRSLAARHDKLVAIDLPSGVETDTGRPLNPDLPANDLTLALGAWKPAHALMPALATLGEMRLVPIGIGEVPGAARLIARPRLSAPPRDAHKYSRGLVLVVEGPMTGAALLACAGAMHAGAGAVRLSTERVHPAVPPDVVLRAEPLGDLLGDRRTGAVVAGPGLGRDAAARERLSAVLSAGRPSVIDADALALLRPGDLERFDAPLVLTPHAGEMASLAESFGIAAIGKVEQARALARAARAVVVFKGPDTVIAGPDGSVGFLPTATSWLSVGGSGDVLGGVVAARLAATGDPFQAASEGAWLHAEAARLAGPAFLASGLARHVSAAVASCL
ncbi:MAG: bifunctional ADP-dependent NAD(P)H-hydrate dehydratase/NAD(P)H-hydrate epimerase [Sphingomonadales bacterium 32-68-7]|nr:MAG: bifunctional ADP-dependent NAD(P)H-hydrate dehydratase/NAD(P)H-hydrate epimerase [Sphingomonadales bacterium 12-68-11]OYX08632.1 MAG: bifunctional ADP-dependent NAD(P)H-hydrate dehydratase/NAD(P)H-hydrate epimerase [Sphingomonadales bacterium 32-68-7]